MSRVLRTPTNRIKFGRCRHDFRLLCRLSKDDVVAPSIGHFDWDAFLVDRKNADQIGRSSHYVSICSVEMARNIVSDVRGRPIRRQPLHRKKFLGWNGECVSAYLVYGASWRKVWRLSRSSKHQRTDWTIIVSDGDKVRDVARF